MATSAETKLTAAVAVGLAIVTIVAAIDMVHGNPTAINGVIGAGFGTIVMGWASLALYRLDREYGPH